MRKCILPILILINSFLIAQNKQIPTTIDVDVEGPFCETTLEMFKITKVILLETNDNSIFADVYKVLRHNNRLIVYDFGQRCVLSFDTDGNFINKIGKEGRGPKEFIRPDDVAIGKNGTVGILDNNQRKVLLYNLDGEHLKDVYYGFYAVKLGVEDSDNILLYNLFQNNSGDRHNVYHVNGKGKIQKKYFPFSEKMDRYTYLSFDVFTKNENQILYRRGYSDTIYSLSENRFYPKYILDFGEYSFDENFFLNYTGNHIYVRSAKEYNFADGISCFYDVGNYFMFKYGYENQKRTVLYNKESGEYKSYLHKRGKDFFAFLWPISAYKNEVYCVLMPQELEYLEEKLRRMDYPEEEKERFRKLAKEVEITDNPVIVVCEIKDF